MRFVLSLICALAAMSLFGPQPARAFTFEGAPTTNRDGSNVAPQAGYMNIDPNSVLPPVGEPVPSMKFNDGPGSRNNGWASPPSRRDSIGPGWLYGPQ
jgi:hypothetical protein